MNDSAVNIEDIRNIAIDPDFESVCPPLTEDEFAQLEENILSDGEVRDALVVWNNTLIDGHNRRQIILKHPELPFQMKEISFNDKYEAIAWICKNQTGRRNLTSDQLAFLIGMQYEAERHTNGAADGFRGNQNAKVVVGKSFPLPDAHVTSSRIASENGISERTVRSFGAYAKGVNAAEAACPGIKQELLSGSLKPTRKEVSSLAKLSSDEVADKISEFRKAQAEQEKKRRQEREEKRRKADETEITESGYSSLSELSARMAEPKPRNNVSNVIGIISSKAQELQEICESYIDEFPELLQSDKPRLLQALDDLREYMNDIYKED